MQVFYFNFQIFKLTLQQPSRESRPIRVNTMIKLSTKKHNAEAIMALVVVLAESMT